VKVVADTNVLYAAFVSAEGTCAQLLELLIRTRALVLSQFILDELRTHLAARERLSPALVDRQIALLASSGTIVVPAAVPADACRDPHDLPVLGTLVAAGGDCLVTGDQDLLALETFGGRPILRPRQLLDRLRQLPPPSGR